MKKLVAESIQLAFPGQPPLRRVLALIIGCWFAVVAMPATAATAGATWLCWYDREVSILCRIQLVVPSDNVPEATGSVGKAPSPAGMTSQSRGLPTVAKTIWFHPGQLQEKQVRIPLFTEPEDMNFVRQLADSVMCGSVTTCTVRFLESQGAVALMLDELEDAS